MKLSLESLHQHVAKVLEKHLNSEQASAVADYIVWAEATGNKTQGVVKLTGTEPMQDIVPKYDMKVERDTKLSQLIDAGSNPAPLATLQATDVAIEKAKAHGFGLVGVHNTFSSNGAQAYYAEEIAKEDLIGIICSRSPAATSGFGSIDPLFGTNPLGFGFPSDDGPLVFDSATSAMTFYGLVLAKARGEHIPEGLALDRDGMPTTDPEAAMSGSILPFDRSYKGAGFAMVVEVLAGPLAASAWIDNKTFKEEWGTLVMAIDPELLVDIGVFKANVAEMVQRIKSSRTREGESIRLPGESARAKLLSATQNNVVEIDEALAKELGFTL